MDIHKNARLSLRGREEMVRLVGEGLTRKAAELSYGTLRYLLWAAALLTTRPPALMVLNEPETSLHPELLPALARLILRAAEETQIIVVSHAAGLIEALTVSEMCKQLRLEKTFGETAVAARTVFDKTKWDWPAR